MIVQALSAVYGAAATWRRRWYARDPKRVHRLSQPVISVGNLRIGGSGKTPAVASLARLLLAQGERPAILSRGYGRAHVDSGVTVVSDGTRIHCDVARSGDEPMQLARALPQVPVLVCADRYRAGLEAEARFGVTVHLLDDGFQHVKLGRDVDLLLVDEGDLVDRVLPAGRLREPLANARLADAVLVSTPADSAAVEMAARLGVGQAFHVVRALGEPLLLDGTGALTKERRVYAVAGIARPERFFADLRDAGWTVTGTRSFRDHHRFSALDITAIVAAARASGAEAIATTEKDAVRLAGMDPGGLPWAAVPLHTTIEPAARFADWLSGRLAGARLERSAASPAESRRSHQTGRR